MKYRKKSNDKAAYELWFKFLQLADPKTCTEAVRKDFGNVWKTDFDTWWTNHSYLFDPMAPQTFEVIENIGDYKGFEGSEDLLIITVPLLESKTYLREEFEKFLRIWHPAKVGRPKFEKFSEKYKLDSRPYIQGLEQTLKVYNFKKLHPTMTGMQIEEKLKLINKNGKNAGKIWKKSTKPKELERMWNIQRSTVSRYLRQADKLIENVAKGIFPLNK
jgi:hypothetical protein